MLDVVATDEHELSSPIHACRIDHSQSGLASAGGAVAQALAAKPAHEPQGQRQQPENHYEREQYFERVSLAEQGVEHHTSPAPSAEGIRLDCSSRERHGIATDLNTAKINEHIRSVLLLYTRSIADVNSRIQWRRSYFAPRLRTTSHYVTRIVAKYPLDHGQHARSCADSAAEALSLTANGVIHSRPCSGLSPMLPRRWTGPR
jgi:hypothetical protein